MTTDYKPIEVDTIALCNGVRGLKSLVVTFPVVARGYRTL